MKNRKQRRAEKSAFKKELKGVVFNSFENMTMTAINSGVKFPDIGELIGFYKNSIYSVQVYKKKNDSILLGIRRHDQKPSCPWKHKQAIKNHILGDEAWAIETFPPVSKLTDQANMYWIWSRLDVDELCENLGGIKK